jgi:hypothetical protein
VGAPVRRFLTAPARSCRGDFPTAHRRIGTNLSRHGPRTLPLSSGGARARGVPVDKEQAVNAQSEASGISTLLKALFVLVAVLVLSAMGYAAWIVLSYWDRIAV